MACSPCPTGATSRAGTRAQRRPWTRRSASAWTTSAWIDEDDDNVRNADGLYGVVHFIDDPVLVDNALRFRIDLGSAPAAAVSDLVELLLDRGAVAVALH